MANGFGSLFIGVSGLQNSQNALNITANNLANVDTKGYVRQQVLYSDRNYVTLSTTPAVGKMQSGLGVKIGDVLHTRDMFLDRLYRVESGRLGFYEATYEASSEVETYFQEMEGQTFQDAIGDFYQAFQELAKAPDDSIYQNLVIQKAQLFTSRAGAVYAGLQSYQYNINTQISDDVKRINELGNMIHELNDRIQNVEAADVETAMTLRDARDLAIDELSGLVEVSCSETVDGIVRISVEGHEFIDEATCHEVGMKRDKASGFITPYWTHLSDPARDEYTYLFSFDRDISMENENDMGSLKALLLARGDKTANYTDILDMRPKDYNDTTGMSVMLRAEAQIDQLFHGMVTEINNLLCPNTDASNYIAGLGGNTTVTMTDAEGNTYTVKADTQILDMDQCAVGSNGELPPQELFTRLGTERYTKVTYTDPATGEKKDYYLYNEEDPFDTTKQYTLKSVSVNEKLVLDETLFPHLRQNGDVDQQMGEALAAVWKKEILTVSPNDGKRYCFGDYYAAMTGEFATFGKVYGATTLNLQDTVLSVDNQRQQVMGVSSDEELGAMIKYQNAYNASSRFINVVNEMIEHLIMQLG